MTAVCLGGLLAMGAVARSQTLLVEETDGEPSRARTITEDTLVVVAGETDNGTVHSKVYTFGDSEAAPEPVIVELTQPSLVQAAVRRTPAGARRLLAPSASARVALEQQQAGVIQALGGIVGRMRGQRTSTASVMGYRFRQVMNGFAAILSPAEQKELARNAAVLAIYPDTRVAMSLDTSVPLVGATQFWSTYSFMGEGTVIAIIDTGVNYLHPDLGGCFGPGCKVIGGKDFENKDDDPMDDNGHGSHVASIASANGVLKGVAPGASILAYKALDASGSGLVSNIIKALDQAADPDQNGSTDDRADVINLSLGAAGDPDDPVSQAVDNATAAGSVVVAAAGNSGKGFAHVLVPAAARTAIAVAATDDHDEAAGFTSTGPTKGTFDTKPDLAAPGVGICGANADPAFLVGSQLGPDCLDGQHMEISGTSMASPHVAGAAALLRGLFPALSPAEIKSLLVQNTVDLGLPVLTVGSGRLDIVAAAQATTVVEPTAVSFGRDDLNSAVWTTTRNFTVRNLDSVARSYVLSTATLPAGITATLSPAAFTLAPGADRAVGFDLVVDNTTVPPVFDPPHAYEGVVLVQSGSQRQRIPFAFVTIVNLTLKFDEKPSLILLHNRDNFSKVRVAHGKQVKDLFVPPGTYDVMWENFSQPGLVPPLAVYVEEGLSVQSDKTIAIKTPKRLHFVTFRPTDDMGNLLLTSNSRTLRVAFQGSPQGTASFSIIGLGNVGTTPRLMRVMTGDLSDRYRLDFGVTAYSEDRRKEFLVASSITDGISGDRIVGNDGALTQVGIRYYPRGGQTPEDTKIVSGRWLLLNGGAVGLINGNSSPFGLYRRLFLAPSVDEFVPQVRREEVFPLPWDSAGAATLGDDYSVQAESLHLRGAVGGGAVTGHNSYELSNPPATYVEGDEIPLGLGPYSWWLRTDNSPVGFALDLPQGSRRSGVFGFMSQASGRPVELPSEVVSWELRSGGGLVDSGTLPQLYGEGFGRESLPSLALPEGTYTLSADGAAYSLRGTAGTTHYEANFDTTASAVGQLYDPDPPWMSSLKILGEGRPNDVVREGVSYALEAVVRDDNNNDASGVAGVDFVVSSTSGDLTIPAAAVGGDLYRAVVTTPCVPGPVNLSLVTADTAGNTMRQDFTPGFLCVSSACGNGVLDAGEQCDDGNTLPDDCCSELCTYEPVGTVCEDDGQVCTADICDGAGVCTHTSDLPEPVFCEDGDVCTAPGKCAAGQCVAGPLYGLLDADMKSSFGVGASDDRMRVKLKLDTSNIGSQPSQEGMDLVLLDSSGTEAYRAHVPASAFEDRRGTRRTFRFSDRQGTPAGVSGLVSVRVRFGRKGEVTIRAKARDTDLSGLAGQTTIGAKVIFGQDAAADCGANLAIPCTASGNSMRCRI